MVTPQKRKILSLDTKYEIIGEVDMKCKSKTDIAKEFVINPKTRAMILKQSDAIESGEYSL